MTPIGKIKNAAKKCVFRELDEPVYLDSDIGIYNFAERENRTLCYVDVPVKAVAALCRNDFWEKGSTWKGALDSLRGDGWTEQVFQYFTSDVRDSLFPAPSSNHELRLSCVGGVCEVGNGNHRLVAAKNWLISQDGPNARLRKVKVSYYPLASQIKSLLAQANKDGLKVQVFTEELAPPVKIYIRLYHWTKEEIWNWDGESLNKDLCYGPAASFCCRLFRMKPRIGESWKPIPPNVINLMVDDSWLSEQLAVSA